MISFASVSNPIEHPKMQIFEKAVKDWCASRGNIPYFETSAKEDYNVDDAFMTVARIALAYNHDHDQDM